MVLTEDVGRRDPRFRRLRFLQLRGGYRLLQRTQIPERPNFYP